MKNKQVFQYVILAVFGVGAIMAVLVFSGKIKFGGTPETEITGSLTVWGPFPQSEIRALFTQVQETYKELKVTYIPKDPRTFQADLVDALASGTGPDLFFFPPEELYKNTPRLFEVPFASYPELAYKGTFVDQAARNLTPTGVLAVPVAIDPLILYYNVDLLSSAFIVKPPENWDELGADVSKLTEKTNSGTLTKSAIAFGAYDNITNAKEIVSLILLQSGTPITTRNSGGQVIPALNQSIGRENVAERAFAFYTQFSNPASTMYTWNPSLPNDKQQFLAGRVAFYIGYASEFGEIQKKNPNLNFEIALMPQRASATTKMTYGTMHSLGISKLSKNRKAALVFMLWFTKTEQAKRFSEIVMLAPARKDILAQKPKDDAYKTLVFNSAIISRGWIDPDGVKTDALLGDTVRAITSGTAQNISQAIQLLNAGFATLIK